MNEIAPEAATSFRPAEPSAAASYKSRPTANTNFPVAVHAPSRPLAKFSRLGDPAGTGTIQKSLGGPRRNVVTRSPELSGEISAMSGSGTAVAIFPVSPPFAETCDKMLRSSAISLKYIRLPSVTRFPFASPSEVIWLVPTMLGTRRGERSRKPAVKCRNHPDWHPAARCQAANR